MRRIKIKGLVFISLALLLLLVTMPSAWGASPKPIKMGYLNSGTGVFAPIGAPAIKAMQKYTEYLNKKGGIAGHPVEVVIGNSESDAVKAKLVFKKFVEQDKVHFVMGESASGVAVGLGPVAAENKIMYSANNGGRVELAWKKAGPEVFKWAFRTNCAAEDHKVGNAFFQLKSMGIKNVASLSAETGYGKFYSAFAAKMIKAYGLNAPVVASYPADAVTFGAVISKIKRSNPKVEAIAVAGAEMASGLCVNAIREAGIKLPIVIDPALVSGPIMAVEKVRNAYNVEPGCYLSGTWVECWKDLPKDHPQQPVLAEYAAFYKEYFNEELGDIFQIVAITSMTVVKAAFENMFADKPNILDEDLATIRATMRDYMETVKDVPNGCGIATVTPDDHYGLRDDTQWAQFQNGQIRWIKENPYPGYNPPVK